MSVLGQFQRGVVGDFCGFDQGRRRGLKRPVVILRGNASRVLSSCWLLERIVQSFMVNEMFN